MKSIIYIGMDVHTTNFTLCSYTVENNQISHVMKVAPDYRNVLSYLGKIRFTSCKEIEFVCGYEAGCLGYTLYHDLTNHGIKCIILAPTTMANVMGKKKVKTGHYITAYNFI